MSSRAAWLKALDGDFFNLLFFLMNLLPVQAEVKGVVWLVLLGGCGFQPSFVDRCCVFSAGLKAMICQWKEVLH